MAILTFLRSYGSTLLHCMTMLVSARLILPSIVIAMQCVCLAEEREGFRFFTVDVKGEGNPIERVRLTLPDAEPGTRLRATVDVRNQTKEDISFLSGASSCKCTQVKVPKTTIAPGDVATMEFEFAVPVLASKLLEQFSVTVNSKGARSVFSFVFNCQLRNVVSLMNAEGVFQYSEKDEAQFVRIPVLLSDPEDVERVTVVSDEQLRFSNPRLIKEGENVFAQFTYDHRLLDKKTITGSVRLMKKGKALSEQLFTMRYLANLRVLPERIVFVVGDVPEIQREATVLIKIADVGKGDDDLTIRAIDCRVSSDTRLRCGLTPMSKGVYRVHLTSPTPILGEKPATVHWKITKSSGEVIHLQSMYSLSN